MRERKEVESPWAADTDISRPEAPNLPVMVDFAGFGFTMNGMVHNVSESEIENTFHPTFAPEGYRGGLDENVLGDPTMGQ